MVAPLPVTFDIASVAVSTAIPGVAWALLFALAWRHPSFAESLGLGARSFWLLLPGALLASFALLPVVPIGNNVLAVSFAGAAFPLAIGVLAFGRVAPPARRSIGTLFAALGAETVVLLAVVLLADTGRLGTVARGLGVGLWAVELGVVVALAAVAALVVFVAVGAAGRVVGGAFVLTSSVLVLTFAGARAIPGVGIAEAFPYFLLPPLAAGVAAVLLAPRLLPGAEGAALPLAFLAAGWGVVLGADVLWEPPLYGTGPAGLYAIGGAGVLDLVYLSGFLGLLTAWGVHRLLGRPYAPVGSPLRAEPRSPSGCLRAAYARGVDGALRSSLEASADAARTSADQARRLLGLGAADPTRPWDGLKVPGWVVSDQANLDSIARSGTGEPREAIRAWLTARALVRLGAALGGPRFASVGQRLAAFAIDVAAVGAAGAALFAAIVLATPGNLDAVLGSVAFNAAVYGFVAGTLLYFALAELWTGATLGKWVLGIEVRDRSLRPVDGLAAFVRNTPLLPVMTLYALGLSVAITIALRGVGPGASVVGVGLSAGSLAILGLGAVVLVGVGFAGAIGLVAMAVTAERQRVGDLWAGTWVVRRTTPARAPPRPAPAVRSA